MSVLSFCSILVFLCCINVSVNSLEIGANRQSKSSIYRQNNDHGSNRNSPDGVQTGRNAIMHVLQCIFQKSDRSVCFMERAERALNEQKRKLLGKFEKLS